ncbi:MAG TPA: decaprenyl-phosphate phosphoribosyltransferase [Myxococcaceae bacterium]|nr:decaprenyl-phosphate phosphoribosyltransferase [Myxococcaceae bacterium]
MTPSRLPAWVRVLRPRQWAKNLAVFAPLLFAKAVFIPDLAARELLAFVSFCFLSSGTYVFNDWIDREEDRKHPEKALRPIAARQIRARTVLLLIVFCWAAGLDLGLMLGWKFVALGAVYLAIQVAYTLVLKHHVILDVLCIAAGFVLRVLAGAVAIDVPVSGWLFLCALLLALFLGLAKRRQELVSLQEEAANHRASLGEYSLPLLDQMLSTVAGMCILAYGLYTVSPDTVAKVGSDRLKWTLPFVLYGILRYLFLIHRRHVTGSPERVLFSDVPTVVNLLLYAVAVLVVLYAVPR